MGRQGVVLLLLLALLAVRCGDNVSGTGTGTGFPPPTNLGAFSADSQAVQLQWTAPAGVTDSSFKDYLIVWGAKQDSIAKGALTYKVDSLSPGEMLFTLFSRDKSGGVGIGAGIRWAPAERFVNPYVIYENRGVLSAGD